MKHPHARFMIVCLVGIGLFVACSTTRREMKPVPEETESGGLVDGPMKTLGDRYSDFIGKRPEDRVYLHLDKPLYVPGDTVWFRAYVRDAADMKPSRKSEILHVEFLDPLGKKDKELHLIARNGVASGDIMVRQTANRPTRGVENAGLDSPGPEHTSEINQNPVSALPCAKPARKGCVQGGV